MFGSWFEAEIRRVQKGATSEAQAQLAVTTLFTKILAEEGEKEEAPPKGVFRDPAMTVRSSPR